MRRLKQQLTVSNLLSCIALFVALSGVAYAATLGKNAVKTRNIARGAVTATKLRNGAVTAAKLRNGAVTTPKLGNGAVTGAKIASATIGSDQLANGSVRAGQLGGGVVTEAKIKNGAVSEAKLGANAVSTTKIQEGAISSGKLAPNLLAQLVRNVSYVTKISPGGGNLQSATAECPAGKQVIGGGAKANPGGAETAGLTESYPSLAADGKRTGWTATVTREGTDGGVISVEAFAICAEL